MRRRILLSVTVGLLSVGGVAVAGSQLASAASFAAASTRLDVHPRIASVADWNVLNNKYVHRRVFSLLNNGFVHRRAISLVIGAL